MGASQCCQGANQGDKKHEVNYDNQNSIQKAKKIKNIGKDNKLEHVSQYSLNPTNCQSDQQNVRQDINDSSDSSSDSSITSNKNKDCRYSQQVEDIYSDEQQPSELINEIQRIKGINKEPSEYYLLMKEKYIMVSKVLKKQYFRYMKHHAKSKEEILELKVLEKQIKNTIFQEFFKNELIISQKDGENAKNRLVKFTKSNGYDYLSLQKLDIWFDEEWYTEQNEIIDVK
ncbi:hypothetical protein PPERSA_05915 [Pseudocohnilembus persalinus]|uniref:Uncharacterized protein n=1 Tax=Pseudocohnilembus persalinus TaxID=266149 RepID=A0A0V0R457_PSEPJ|nr:hypothetical protein PPERSA_05915 [Pseudocohnilembus persalinus]|eukprot:KRX09246.1 hypothetical protein PPERSA_05915 [Pseudocohnilembus persalinus]